MQNKYCNLTMRRIFYVIERRISKKCSYIIIVILFFVLVYKEQFYRANLQNYEESKQTRYLAKRDPQEHLHFDTRSAASDADILAALEEELPYLDSRFLIENHDKGLRLSENCAHFPNFDKIEIHNNYWQTFRSTNVTFQLYGAYYDNRPQLDSGPVVRLLAMINQTDDYPPRSFCQFWYENKDTPIIVSVASYELLWNKNWGVQSGLYLPHLLTCILPEAVASLIPRTVSLVTDECAQATNNLRVVYDNPQIINGIQQEIAICVKGLDFPYEDISGRLVEWLEIMRLFGAHKIYAYNIAIHPNISKVLRHYQEDGFLEIRPWTLSTNAASTPAHQHYMLHHFESYKRFNELIPYNDCFYRNIYKYKYIAIVDIDEVVMPLGGFVDWHDIISYGEQIKNENCKQFPAFCFVNVYYPTNLKANSSVPSYLPVLRHFQRSAEHSPLSVNAKCFHSTALVKSVHNHYPLHFMDACYPVNLNTTKVQMQHYKKITEEHYLKEVVNDSNIWRYGETLMRRTKSVLQKTGFLEIS